MHRPLLALALLGCAACGSDQSHPPEFVPGDAMGAPRSCAEVRAGEVHSGAFWVAGGPARCGPTAQECPVFDLQAHANLCKQGVPFASCQSGTWVVHCELDSGISDASSD